MTPDDPRHGTPAGHNAGCRCARCGTAKLAYDKQRRWEIHSTGRRRLVPSYRAVRRIHALQALGYSVREVAEEAGLCTKTLYDISLERSTHTWRRHFEPLEAAYERLAGTVPVGRYVGRNRRYAATQGWPPPLAYDNIDDPDEHPTDWQYKPADRAVLLAELLDRGAGVWEACRVLHMSREALQKWCGSHDLSPLYRALAARGVTAANQYTDLDQAAS